MKKLIQFAEENGFDAIEFLEQILNSKQGKKLAKVSSMEEKEKLETEILEQLKIDTVKQKLLQNKENIL